MTDKPFKRKLCKKCREPIYFIKMLSDSLMPVNIGLVAIVKATTDRYTIITADGRTIKNPPPGTEGYISHFATCPFASQFRKKAITRKPIKHHDKHKRRKDNDSEKRTMPGDAIYSDAAIDDDL